MTTETVLQQVSDYTNQAKEFMAKTPARSVIFWIEDLPYDVFIDIEKHFPGKISDYKEAGNVLFRIIHGFENEGVEICFFTVPLKLKTIVEVITE